MVNVLKKDLLNALIALSKCWSKNKKFITLRAHDTVLEIHSSNDSAKRCSYSVNIPATVNKFFIASIDAKDLKSLLKLLPQNSIRISVNNDKLCIESGGVKREFPTLEVNASIYSIYCINHSISFSIPSNLFKDLVNSTFFAATNILFRPMFSNCFFSVDKRKIFAVATDTNQIAKKSLVLENDTGLQKDFLINAKILSDFVKLIKKNDSSESVLISFDDGIVALEYDNILVVTKQYTDASKYPILDIDHKYIERFAPVDISCKTDYLQDSLNRLLLIVKDNVDKPIKLTIHYNEREIWLTAKDQDVDVVEKLPAGIHIKHDNNSEKYPIWLNAQYLLTALKSVNDEFCLIQILGKKLPIRIRKFTDDMFNFVLSPLRMEDENCDN